MARKKVGTANLNTGAGFEEFIDSEGVRKKQHPSPDPLSLWGIKKPLKPPFEDKNLHIYPTREQLP